MAGDKLSVKEAALIAAARAQVAHKPGTAAPLAPPTVDATPRPAELNAAAANPPPATHTDPAERVAALMAAARAETERLRTRQRKLYVLAPLGLFCVLSLCVLLWMWQRL